MSARREHPIVIIGAGGIVTDAHLPAYRKAGFQVAGVYDQVIERAKKLATTFGVEQVFTSLDIALARQPAGTIFDVAVPACAFAEILKAIPDGSAVLLQKPLGESLSEARKIRSICCEKHLSAAVNFQLRLSPVVLRAREIIEQGRIGDLHDIEVRIAVYTPWHLWKFLEEVPRVEILYHSIHYIDLIRSFLGEPMGVYARTVKHPLTMKLASTRTAIILNYGDVVRANIATNHEHIYGAQYQESYVKWEGTKGAIRVQLGALMDYPRGQPDRLEYVENVSGQTPQWRVVEVSGTWFPDAFIGTMRNFMDYLDGRAAGVSSSVEDACKTMAVVEAAYEADRTGGSAISYL